MADEAQVVRHEQDRQLQSRLQLEQQVDHLRLHRDVEGGDHLVGDQAVRPDGQSAGDGDPLALAARELVR